MVMLSCGVACVVMGCGGVDVIVTFFLLEYLKVLFSFFAHTCNSVELHVCLL